MLYVVIAYLWAAICLYLILGGADFGAGIVELISGKETRPRVRNLMYKAIGPIWEANHMWLIIAIVILFVGFPEIYTTMSIYMHLPLLMMLIGIIARGTAFTFRNYDAVEDNMQTVYFRIFTISSLITPFFLGIIAASTVSSHIDTQATDFYTAYISSWFNWFGIAVGLFTVAICGYLASIFAIGQVEQKEDRRLMIRLAKLFVFVVMGCGVLVFAAAYYSHIPLLNWVLGDIWGQIAIFLASCSVIWLFISFRNESISLMRVLAGFQVVMILFAATYKHYPNLILLKNGQHLSLVEHAGAEGAISSLAWALLLGSIFILPTLFYLMYSFSRKSIKAY
ncbi:cytochrome d ubiquinol oxidase subunit II [Sphingobacterium spiritivorum]|uniref:cytochrome d ubiquinol oxidase subunit II n=1 Tax=Sphingobacterium spiritivorum TaxID=258 RepID=UPI003DA4E9AC